MSSSQLDKQEPQSSASSITVAENHYHSHDPSSAEKSKPGSFEDHTLKPRPWIRKTTPYSRIIEQPYDGAGTREQPFLIDWVSSTAPATDTGEKGSDETKFVDVENPMTYGKAYKWSIVVLAAMSTLGVSMASSMLSAAVFDMRADFPGKTMESYIMVTSGFVLGFVLGPFIWAPMSEIYGRRSLFIYTYIAFTLFNGLVCASQNLATVIVFRFLAGTFGASAMTNAGGVVADVFEAKQRGLGMAVFASAPFMGPAIGPIIGGFLGEHRGWRWVAGLLTFFSGFLTLLGFLFLPETYGPVILRQRAKRLSKITGDVYLSRADASAPTKARQVFGKALAMPWILLFKEPIVALMALYLAVIYAILYMLFTAFPIVFQQNRGWSPGIGGLAFIGIAVGVALALAYVVVIENPRYSRKLKSQGGWLVPEERLFTAMVGGIMLPAGLFIFAWTAVPTHIHWIAPIIGSVPFGCGMVLVFLGVLGYLVDAYLIFAASVLAGNTVVRSIFGVAFPLFTKRMFDNLGVNYAGTLIACLALLFAPSPFIFYVYGKKIRRSTAFGRIGDDIGQMLKAGMTPVQIQKAMTAAAAAKKAEGENEVPAGVDVEASINAPAIASAGDDAVGVGQNATKEQV